MTTLTLDKIKLVFKGDYSSGTTYTQGDIVMFRNRSFIYKNETAKVNTPIYSMEPLEVSITSIPAFSSTFTVTLPYSFSNLNTFAPLGNLYVYSKWLEPDSKIVSMTQLSPTTVSITVSKAINSNVNLGAHTATIGTRRMAGVYETCLNDVDWDVFSDTLSDDNNYTSFGHWNRCRSYTPGEIVIRNNQSYICTQAHGSPDPAARFTRAVDPLFDYLGCWETFLVGNEALPHERIVIGVNKNPFNWRGHPYITKPTFGNSTVVNATAMIPGTTYTIVTTGNTNFNLNGASLNYVVGEQFICTSVGTGTGTVACAYSSIPWFIPATHKDPDANPLAAWTWSWNSWIAPAQQKYRGSVSLGSDGRGHRIGKGHGYYGQGAPGQYDGYRLFAGEEMAQHFNEYYSDQTRQYGNESFNDNHRRGSGPRLTQNLCQWTTQASLTSYGTVLVGGTSSGSSLGTGEDADYSSSMIELGRQRFGNRAIVKLAGGASNSRNSSVWYAALDEFGELWTWGYNGYGQCGIGPENHLSSGMRIANRTDNVRSPMCLQKDIFFEGNRIIDVFTQENSIHALDEAGNLWGWGRNNYGQLGFTTSGVMASASQCAAPYKVPITWSTYGGIQKIVTPSHENREWIMVLDGQGHVWTMGYNDHGQLGTNNATSDGNSSGPLRRTSSTAGWGIGGGIKNIWGFDGGTGHSYFLDTSLQLWGCGHGGHYEFGTSTSNVTTPAQYYGPKGAMTDIVQISGQGRSGANTMIALDKDGISYAHGWNQYGEGGVGHGSYVGNNNTYNQQNGTSSTQGGWSRVLMPSPMYGIMFAKDLGALSETGQAGSCGNRIVDLWGNGDYDGPAGHIVTAYWLTERGEVLTAGRDYNYNLNGQGEPQYAPMSVTNFM